MPRRGPIILTVATAAEWEMTMSTITNQTAEPSLGAYFVQLFKVDADQFQLLSEKPQSDRGCEFLNRPYELSNFDAASDSRWPLAAPIGCEYPIERPTLRMQSA